VEETVLAKVTAHDSCCCCLRLQAGLPQCAVVAAHGNFDSEWPAEQVASSSPRPLLGCIGVPCYPEHCSTWCHTFNPTAVWLLHMCGLHSALCSVLTQGNPAVVFRALPTREMHIDAAVPALSDGMLCAGMQVRTASSATKSTAWSMSSRQSFLTTSATAPAAGEWANNSHAATCRGHCTCSRSPCVVHQFTWLLASA
jgi:hypothetical protein